METLKKLRIFSGNALKIIAAITMLIDHFGLMFYPQNMALRAIGRLAMPLFAFMIAESARYTRNKLKHFAMLFGLGAICQIVYRIAMGENSMELLNILITFSLSTLILYALDAFKISLFKSNAQKREILPILITAGVLVLSIVGAYIFCKRLTVDYNFWGVMLPVFANLLDFRAVKKKLGDDTPKWIHRVDVLPLRIACFAVGMLLLYWNSLRIDFPMQYMFLTLPLLLLYNGERGKANLKYFFYLFYPLHLVLLEGLYILKYFL